MIELENSYSEAEMQEVLAELEKQTETIEEQKRQIQDLEAKRQMMLPNYLLVPDLQEEIENLSEENQTLSSENQMLKDKLVTLNETDLLQKQLNEQQKKQEQQQKLLDEQKRKQEKERQELQDGMDRLSIEKDRIQREGYNLDLRIEKYEAEVDAEVERVTEDTRKHYEKMEKLLALKLAQDKNAIREEEKGKYETYRKEKDGLFDIVSVIAIGTAVFSACTRKVFWGDFKDFWVNGAVILAKVIKTVCVAIWGVVMKVYEGVPYTVLDVILAVLVATIGYFTIPVLIYLLISKKKEDFWRWYKPGLSSGYITITSCVLLIGMFWGEYTIKVWLPWWNLWGMWILFAILFSFFSAWWYKDNPRYY